MWNMLGGNDNNERISALEKSLKAILTKVGQLEIDINKNAQDYEQEAKEASDRVKEYAEQSNNNNNEIAKSLKEANEKIVELRESYSSFEELKKSIDSYHETSEKNSNAINTLHQTIITQVEELQNKISELQDVLDSRQALDEKIQRIEEIYNKSSDYDTKIGLLNNGITDRKKEIDALYYDIIGTTIENEETGEHTDVPGKKAELEDSYTQLKTNIAEQNKVLAKHISENEKNYDSFIKVKEEQYNGFVKKIDELLPNALTTGLSYAYQEKRINEVETYRKLSITFIKAIWGLIGVSLLPIFVSIYSIVVDKVKFVDALERVPRLVIAIIPLYIPVLWVAYSANKKRNLSKRLIEEYSHKETISKTFEGLSRQIENIDNKEVSADLRVKLLYNILSVNSENPGKLISDYDKSDHPLMDALEKSEKLGDLVTKLAQIPGLGKLATTLSNRAEELLQKNQKNAEVGIDVATKEDKKD